MTVKQTFFMPQTQKHFEESGLAFTFGERWQVGKLDEHRDYRRGLGTLEGSKAVDFLGILDGRELYLIEVKNFRHYRIENKERLSTGELALELAQKVRDSLACLIGAYHTSDEPDFWQPVVKLLCHQKRKIKIVLWLEHDLPPSPLARQKVVQLVSKKVFKSRLTWLTSQVILESRDGQRLPDLQVSNLPRPP